LICDICADLELNSSFLMNRISAAHFPRFLGGTGARGLIFGTRSTTRRTGFQGLMTCG
jgi:hypothetical protein